MDKPLRKTPEFFLSFLKILQPQAKKEMKLYLSNNDAFDIIEDMVDAINSPVVKGGRSD